MALSVMANTAWYNYSYIPIGWERERALIMPPP